jgi:hypothetical protein
LKPSSLAASFEDPTGPPPTLPLPPPLAAISKPYFLHYPPQPYPVTPSHAATPQPLWQAAEYILLLPLLPATGLLLERRRHEGRGCRRG